MTRKVSVDACLNPTCIRVVRVRGLCNPCYMIAKRLVDKGESTWEELEKQGKVLPSKNQNTNTSGWFKQ